MRPDASKPQVAPSVVAIGNCVHVAGAPLHARPLLRSQRGAVTPFVSHGAPAFPDAVQVPFTHEAFVGQWWVALMHALPIGARAAHFPVDPSQYAPDAHFTEPAHVSPTAAMCSHTPQAASCALQLPLAHW